MRAVPGHDLEGGLVPSRVLDLEQRRNRSMGVAAVVAVAASFVALIVLVGSAKPGSGDSVSVRSLQQAEQQPGLLWAAVGLRSLGLVATAIVGVHLVSLVGARARAPHLMRVLSVAAPLALAGIAIASNAALLDSAHTFGGHGAQTEQRAQDLLTSGVAQRATSIAAVVAGLSFAMWLGWTSLAAARVGLLTRFLGYFGVGGAVASVFVPVAGQGLVLGWLGSVGLLLLGWWPGGRGPSWTAGVIAPWISEPQGRPRQRGTS